MRCVNCVLVSYDNKITSSCKLAISNFSIKYTYTHRAYHVFVHVREGHVSIHAMLTFFCFFLQVNLVPLPVQKGHTHILPRAPPTTTPSPVKAHRDWRSPSSSYRACVHRTTSVTCTTIVVSRLTVQAPPRPRPASRARVSRPCPRARPSTLIPVSIISIAR